MYEIVILDTVNNRRFSVFFDTRKVLIDKKILRVGMLNGKYIGLVNIHGFKDEVKKCTK